MIKGMGSRMTMGGLGPASCKIGQLTCSMGLEQREFVRIRTLASKANTPSMLFFHYEDRTFYPFVLYNYINSVFFSPPPVKNKPCEGATA